MDKWFNLTVAILATWRLTHLIQAEDGPFDLIFRIRKLAGRSVIGHLMDCFYCLSIWIAAPFAWWMSGVTLQALILWMAISGGAIFLKKLTENIATNNE